MSEHGLVRLSNLILEVREKRQVGAQRASRQLTKVRRQLGTKIKEVRGSEKGHPIYYTPEDAEKIRETIFSGSPENQEQQETEQEVKQTKENSGGEEQKMSKQGEQNLPGPTNLKDATKSEGPQKEVEPKKAPPKKPPEEKPEKPALSFLSNLGLSKNTLLMLGLAAVAAFLFYRKYNAGGTVSPQEETPQTSPPSEPTKKEKQQSLEDQLKQKWGDLF